VLRTAISVTAAAVAATCALAACGPVQMGAAAIVGDQRISVASLNAQVSNLQSALRSGSGRVQLQFPKSQVPQAVLGWLMRFKIRDQLAVRNGVTVTRGESQQALASIAAQARQSGNVQLADLAAANGLPPDLLPELGRYQAIENTIVRRLDGGTLPKSQSALQQLGQQFNTMQCRAAKSLRIKVNPQFGRMEYTQFSVVPATSILSKPATPSPAPSAGSRFTPPC
jgi:hypothetical protein